MDIARRLVDHQGHAVAGGDRLPIQTEQGPVEQRPTADTVGDAQRLNGREEGHHREARQQQEAHRFGQRPCVVQSHAPGLSLPARHVHEAHHLDVAVGGEVVALWLLRHGGDDGGLEAFGVTGMAAQHGAQVHRMLVAQTQQQAPLGGDAHPVAGVAEVVAVGRDEADPALGIGHAVVARRPKRRLGGGHQGVAGLDDPAHLVARAEGGGAVVADRLAQRHLLDKADIDALGAGERHQVEHLVVVAPLEDHGVELDARETGLPGGADAVDHPGQVAGAGQGAEARRVQGVEADVEAPEAALAQGPGVLDQARAVGGHGEIAQPRQGADLTDQGLDAALDQRLAAGEADLLRAELDEDPAQGGHLLQGQHLGAGQEGHLLGHAVDAAEVATVGDRQANVAHGAAEAVDQTLHGHLTPLRRRFSKLGISQHVIQDFRISNNELLAVAINGTSIAQFG